MADFRIVPEFVSEGLMNNPKDFHSPGRNFNSGPPEYANTQICAKQHTAISLLWQTF